MFVNVGLVNNWWPCVCFLLANMINCMLSCCEAFVCFWNLIGFMIYAIVFFQVLYRYVCFFVNSFVSHVSCNYVYVLLLLCSLHMLILYVVCFILLCFYAFDCYQLQYHVIAWCRMRVMCLILFRIVMLMCMFSYLHLFVCWIILDLNPWIHIGWCQLWCGEFYIQKYKLTQLRVLFLYVMLYWYNYIIVLCVVWSLVIYMVCHYYQDEYKRVSLKC